MPYTPAGADQALVVNGKIVPVPKPASLTEFDAEPALGELQKKLSEVLEHDNRTRTIDIENAESIDLQLSEIAKTLRDLRKWHTEINNVTFIAKRRK